MEPPGKEAFKTIFLTKIITQRPGVQSHSLLIRRPVSVNAVKKLGDLTMAEFGPMLRAALISAVGIPACSHIRPEGPHRPRKSPFFVVEVRSVPFAAKASWRVACFTSIKMRTVRGGQAPNATTASILHKVGLTKHKSHLVLVCSS